MKLTGLKVLDFCWVGAGAFVTRILADLGADVIKVESRAHPDNLRLSPPHRPGAAPLESSGYFASRNTSKRSFALNMSSPKAQEIARELAKQCNMVTNNFRPGVMDKWGLGYDAVSAANPSVIYLSMPMQGREGPHRNYIGFGSTISALCGILNMAGSPGRKPLGTGTHYPDHVPNPGHALVAVLAAAFHRQRTGEGQHIELAQIESTINVLGPSVLHWQRTGTLPTLTGNRMAGVVPRGVFPCKEPDTWCAIEVHSDEQWRALAEALGNPAWATTPGYATLAGRAADEDRIEHNLKSETQRYPAHELMTMLQRHGVPASVVNTNADVLADAQLNSRGYWQHIPHAQMGEVIINRPPFKVVGADDPALGPPPLLGEHTFEIARDFLGLDESGYRKLVDEKVFY